MKLKILLILFFAFFAFTANATDWYVAKTGNDANDGSSWTEAKLTISAMVTASSNGDTIYIGSGDYDEEADLDTANKSITLDGIDKTARIMRTGSSEQGVTLEDDTTIKNLVISTTSKTSYCYAIWGDSKSNIVIEDCNLFGAYDAVKITSCDNIRFSDCTLEAYWDCINFAGCTDLIVNSTSLSTDGTYGLTCTAATIQTGLAGRGVFNDCSITTANQESSAAVFGIGVAAYQTSQIILNNCSIILTAGASNEGDGYGIYTNGSGAKVTANNCTITTSTSGSGTVYDLYNSAGTLYIVDSSYDRNKTYGMIFEGSRCRRRYDLWGNYRR